MILLLSVFFALISSASANSIQLTFECGHASMGMGTWHECDGIMLDAEGNLDGWRRASDGVWRTAVWGSYDRARVNVSNNTGTRWRFWDIPSWVTYPNLYTGRTDNSNQTIRFSGQRNPVLGVSRPESTLRLGTLRNVDGVNTPDINIPIVVRQRPGICTPSIGTMSDICLMDTSNNTEHPEGHVFNISAGLGSTLSVQVFHNTEGRVDVTSNDIGETRIGVHLNILMRTSECPWLEIEGNTITVVGANIDAGAAPRDCRIGLRRSGGGGTAMREYIIRQAAGQITTDPGGDDGVDPGGDDGVDDIVIDITGPEATDPDPDCENQTGGGFQWILCPAIDGGLAIIDWWMRIMEGQLAFSVFAEDSESIRAIWGQFLIIANIAFALVFMAIIYSTATSTGISNYGIKKIMPRIVIGAILVNTSFWITAGISDLINILGHNIRDLILSMAGAEGAGLRVSPPWGHGFVIGVGVAVLLFLTGLIAPAVLAIITMFALLTFRNVAIVVLIIVSPIAFVLWLLPNTEKYFKAWLNNYIRLLFVYPVIMAGWAASQVLAGIFNEYGTGFVAWVAQLLLWVAPVALIIPAFKIGGTLMSRIQGMTQDRINKVGAPAVAKNKEWADANRKYAGGISRNTLQGMARKPVYNDETGQYEKTNMFGRSYKARNSDDLMKKRDKVTQGHEKAAKAARDGLQKKLDYEGNPLTDATRKQLEEDLARAKEGMKSVASDIAEFDDANKPNMAQRGLGFLAGIGTGAHSANAKNFNENSKSNTDAMIQVDAKKGQLEITGATIKAKLDRRAIERDLKMDPINVEFEAKKAAMEAQEKSGWGSFEGQVAQRVAAMEPNNAYAMSQFNAQQKRVKDEQQALVENRFRTQDGVKSSTGESVGSFSDAGKRLAAGEEIDFGKGEDRDGNDIEMKVSMNKLAQADSSARSLAIKSLSDSMATVGTGGTNAQQNIDALNNAIRDIGFEVDSGGNMTNAVRPGSWAEGLEGKDLAKMQSIAQSMVERRSEQMHRQSMAQNREGTPDSLKRKK